MIRTMGETKGKEGKKLKCNITERNNRRIFRQISTELLKNTTSIYIETTGHGPKPTAFKVKLKANHCSSTVDIMPLDKM